MHTHSVLVTGCNGTVGRHVTQELLSSGRRVVGVSLEHGSAISHANLRYFPLDITDPSAVRQILNEHQFDAIVHCAALVHVRDKHFDFADYNKVNHRASEYLFESAAQTGTRRFLFTSTIEVYGATAPGGIVDESTHCSPESDYARSKLLAEEALARVAARTSSNVAILRLAPVYAANFALNFDKRIYLKKPVAYHFFRRDYRLALCSVFNVSHFVATWLSQDNPQSGVFNVADTSTYSIRELLRRERLVGRCRFTVPLSYTACFAGLALLEIGFRVLGRELDMLSLANLRKLVRSTAWDTRKAVDAVNGLPWNLDNTPGFYAGGSDLNSTMA